MEETVELGGNIELKGFAHLDRGSMVIAKKIIGNYAKRFSDKHKDFSKLSLSVKAVHEREKSEKYELHAKLLLGGKTETAEITDRNLFYAIDKVLKKLDKV
jgi:ribosome-associated translation inhibitor RaiA